MGAKVGRPKAEKPKVCEIKVRVDRETIEKFDAYCQKIGKCKAEVLRKQIEQMLQEENL